MNALEKLQAKPREKRTPLEQCIVDAATFEEAEHDGDLAIMELAVAELEHIRGRELEGISAYDIACAATDELFRAGDGTIAHRIELKDHDNKEHGGWAYVPACDIILKHIRVALKAGK